MKPDPFLELKSEYRDKLLDLKVYTKYKKNIILQRNNERLNILIREINKEKSFKHFIRSSFNWTRTKEGIIFWYNISNS